jgi:hypothetical protein
VRTAIGAVKLKKETKNTSSSNDGNNEKTKKSEIMVQNRPFVTEMNTL